MKFKSIMLLIIALISVKTIAQNKVEIYKGGELIYSEYISEIDSIKLKRSINGHAYVDLGLSVKWATCNVGATSPEEVGEYFAWGETVSKSWYDWSTYKLCGGSRETMNKYCSKSSFGTIDDKTQLDLEDDAARINWGGSWRMPTKEEQDELRNTNNCEWFFQRINGVSGYTVKSKKNGNTIFLPIAGYYNENKNLMTANGYYWSSTLYTDYCNNARLLQLTSDNISSSLAPRYYGYPIRPVSE